MNKERSSKIKIRKQNFLGIIDQLIKKEADYAIWRMPSEETVFISANFTGTTTHGDSSIEDLKPGFIVSPFIGEQIYMESEFLWSSNAGTVHSHPDIDPEKTLSSSKLSGFLKSETVRTCTEEEYFTYVENCIKEITSNNLQKIVPARVINFEDKNLDPLEVFLRLTEHYKHSFISLISINKFGTWIGASPELLVQTENNTLFRTVSLAGTQLNGGYKNLKDVLWTQKEIEEQAMVSRYIINCFKKIRLREFSEYGPKTVLAGNLLHLKTFFEVDMEATNFPQLGSVMLKLLHPTSAVCGMPLDKSLEFIKKHEGIDRKLYAGYLGPIHIDKKCSIFVNLRCMEATDEGANLYAGAGVTSDSTPAKEYEETEIKLETLKNIL